MKTLLCLLTLLISVYQLFAQEFVPYPTQIEMAVMACPEGLREEARVYGYNKTGELIVLREGSNELVCLSDNPGREGFEVDCYHKSLEPFMARGRALRSEGKTFNEIYDIREKEAIAGTLDMPDNPSTLWVYYGKNASFDFDHGELTGGKFRYVVYVPFATQNTTGLPLKPNGAGHPWLMDPGKHNAHIMISPTN